MTTIQEIQARHERDKKVVETCDIRGYVWAASAHNDRGILLAKLEAAEKKRLSHIQGMNTVNEKLLDRCKRAEKVIADVSEVYMECEEWCGKSPSKYDAGLCPHCEIKAIIGDGDG